MRRLSAAVPPGYNRVFAAGASRESNMQRTILGVLTAALLLAAILFWFFWPNAEETIMLAFCWRMGLVTLAAWLAFEDIQRLPGWILAVLPILAVVLVRWPRYLVLVLPIVVVLSFLHSRLARR